MKRGPIGGGGRCRAGNWNMRSTTSVTSNRSTIGCLPGSGNWDANRGWTQEMTRWKEEIQRAATAERGGGFPAIPTWVARLWGLSANCGVGGRPRPSGSTNPRGGSSATI